MTGESDGRGRTLAALPWTLAALLALGTAATPASPGGEGTPAQEGAAAATSPTPGRDAPVEAGSGQHGDGPLLYVCNEGEATVTVVDVASREVVTTLDLQELGFSANAKPHHVVVEPDGSHWYVSLIGENRVLKLDRRNRVVGQAEMETPGLMALDPGSDRLYVGRSMKAVRPPQRIGVIRRSDMSIEEREVFVPRPHALALQPDGGWVHTASLANNRIASLPADDDGLQLTELDPPTHTYVQFAVSPDGRRMVATGQTSGRVLLLDVSDPASPELLRETEVGGQPWHPVYAPDGRTVYVPRKAADAVDVIDVGSWKVVATVEGEGLSQPHGSAMSPDGRFLFVSNNNLDGAWRPAGRDDGHGDAADAGGAADESGAGAGAPGQDPPGSVVVIDTETREIVDVLTVGHNPTGVGTRTPTP